jgi:hypothetical protein
MKRRRLRAGISVKERSAPDSKVAMGGAPTSGIAAVDFRARMETVDYCDVGIGKSIQHSSIIARQMCAPSTHGTTVR